LTHLPIIMDHDVCTSITTSHLLSLKSLTDLQLTISKCEEPKVTLIALHPLASVITQLTLLIESASVIDDCTFNRDDSCQLPGLLLPFRSLTYLYFNIPSSSTFGYGYPDMRSYSIEITSSFIRQHWNKLEKQLIHFSATSFNSMCLFHKFLSLSSSTTLPLTSTSSGSENNSKEKDASLFGIKLRNVSSANEFDGFLEDMENALLLIPSSGSPSTIPLLISPHSPPKPILLPYIGVPIISLEVIIWYSELGIASLEYMHNRIKSRNYINMSSFTIHPPA
jgi:hypothetical protein